MIFLASPYRDPDPVVRAWRYEQVVGFCASHLVGEGEPIYSPILHWHPVAERTPHLHERDTAYWMDINRPMLEICDQLWVLGLPGWRESAEVRAEMALVRGFGRPLLRAVPGALGTAWEPIE